MTTLYKYDGKIIRTAAGGLAKDLDCCCEPVGGCTSCTGDAPMYFRVTMSGVANAICNECTRLNSTFILEYLCQITHAGDMKCVWAYEFDPIFCSTATHLLLIIGPGTSLDVSLVYNLNVGACSWSLFRLFHHNISVPTDCLALDETYDVYTTQYHCTYNPVTIHVEAL